ncbi:MAG: CarD family transcriptional regulator [Deltaproteobacteria bacterium]|nr:CarD family transcriptional regulator [Deltaproteobacteria bacterium]
MRAPRPEPSHSRKRLPRGRRTALKWWRKRKSKRPEGCQPRSLQVALTLTIGQKAVYPSRGIAEVVGIEKKEIGGRVQEFYVLRLGSSDLKILVHVDKAEQVGLRPVAGRDDADEVLQILREKVVQFERHTWNRRYRAFMDKIKSGSLFEVAEVFRDLHRLKRTKSLSFGERRMLDTARGLVVQELSVARDVNRESIEADLERALGEGKA